MAGEATYVWEGTDRNGQPGKGEVASSSPAIAKAMLLRQGVKPSRIRRKPRELPGLSWGQGAAPNAKDIAAFTRQVATMMQAGAPLVRSFEIIADGFSKPRMRRLVLAVRDRVAGGDSFASALRQHPQHFDALFCSLIDAGEQAGALETMLDQVAGYQEKIQSLKAKVKKAMTYPAAVVLVAIVVAGILLVEVVPRFEEVFAGFGAELPVFTRMVINLSEFVQAWWLAVLIALGVVIGLLRLGFTRSPPLRRVFDVLALKMPVAGGIIEMTVVARCARTLATTFAAGVPLIDALGSVAGAAGNRLFEEAIMKVREEVSAGHPLNTAMASTKRFPGLVVQMTMIGEEAGALDDMLAKAAAHYEEQVDNRVENLTSLMEPLIMAVLGVLIGGLIIAMYMPIFQLGAAVGG